MRGEFFGRQAELDALSACVAEVEAGCPRLVLVEGAGGIGKTSLLAAFVPALAGWRQLTVAGDEAEVRLPYGLLARLVAGADPAWTAGTVGAGPDAVDPFTVGAALVRVLGELQESGPVAVIVDDAPWSDPPSLAALAFAMRRLQADRVLTVLTLRSDDASRLPPGLLRHGQDDGVHIRLGGLSTEEVRDLGAALGCAALSIRAAERLRHHTGGNPLHLRALFEELEEEELRGTEGPLPAPSSFARLVLAAMASCTEPTQRLLTAAAVLGVRSRLSWAAAVGQVEEPLQALEEAARTTLVEARSDEEGCWLAAFRHPLIRSAVYDDIGPASRTRLHSRAAEVLPGQQALEHRVAAAGEGPDPELVSLLIRRAEEDTREAMPSRAADRLLAAARLTPTGAAKDTLVIEAVDLLLVAGNVAEAAAFADRLASMPDSVPRQLVRAKLAWLSGCQDQVEALAGSTWEQGGDIERAVAAAMLAQVRILDDDNVGAVQWAERALTGQGLPAPLRSEIRGCRAVALALGGQAEDGLRLLGDLPDDPTEVPNDRQPELSMRALLRLMTDDLAGARADSHECALGRVVWGLTIRGLTALAGLTEIEYRSGEWDDSVSHAQQAVSLVTDTGQAWILAFVHANAVLVHAGRGNWAEAEAHVRAASDAASALGDKASAAYAANAAVHLAACRGDAAGVVAAADPILSSATATPREPGLLTWAAPHAAALVALGRIEEAEVALEDFAALGELRGRRSTLAAAARVRGELCAAKGDSAAAGQAFESAVSLGRGVASALDQAMTHASYGRFLRRAGKRRAAGAHLRTAQEAFAGLGARPFLDRCNRELTACGLAVDRQPDQPRALLTTQELAVSRLVCAGRTNREVAAELVVSVKTVGYHLGNAYNKLGVTSRTQLAALLGRHAPLDEN